MGLGIVRITIIVQNTRALLKTLFGFPEAPG
jgi:hypothetical protein